MITAEELRIGNYVYDFGLNPVQIVRLTKGAQPLEMPIPLTPEILEKCGLLLEESTVTYGIAFSRIFDKWGSLTLRLMEHNKGFWVILEKVNLGTIKYLHQLQNLYFALTGQELKINLNVEAHQ